MIGNVLHPSVPVHNDEDFNEVVRTNGDCEGEFQREGNASYDAAGLKDIYKH